MRNCDTKNFKQFYSKKLIRIFLNVSGKYFESCKNFLQILLRISSKFHKCFFKTEISHELVTCTSRMRSFERFVYNCLTVVVQKRGERSAKTMPKSFKIFSLFYPSYFLRKFLKLLFPISTKIFHRSAQQYT